MSGAYEHILIETSPEGVRTLTLNRPEKLNAVNVRMSEELPRAVAEASADDAVRVVVVTGAGRGFCAGLELDSANLQTFRNPQTRHVRLDDLQWVGRWVTALIQCDKPVIAAVNGPSVGAGFGLALAADIRLMSAAAIFSPGYARIGLCPDAGVSYFLPRLIGLARAMEIIMTARDIKPDEAERTGLVAQIIPAETFTETIAHYAEQLAAGPPIALTLTKRLLHGSIDCDIHTQLRNELTGIRQCLATEDAINAMRAFAEKRKPTFNGK